MTHTPTYRLSRSSARIFAGLMTGMLVASVAQTIVGPAMPRIVAELGGMEHYSWVATTAMLVSAIVVPIVGKLSDLYGRRAFYLAGLALFLTGSLIAGFATSFSMLIAARAVQGLGMGTIMPLSQTIIGDIIPPRQRGKYQGYMGAVFGVTSVAGPLAGGFITDHWGWRWLFFAAVPVGLAALVVIWKFLHVPFQRRDARIDVAGIITLSLALIGLLLATSLGGSTYAWNSPIIIALFAGGTAALAAFIVVELRAQEPILPLRLFRSSVFTYSNIGAAVLSMMMFGSIIYIPVYAQGVLGVNATNSGLILMPLMIGFIVLGIASGLIITRTGRYKVLMLTGVVVVGAGQFLLSGLHADSTITNLTIAMVVLGVGLGLVMQQYTLIVQNNSGRADLGISTASIQFFRNVGSTVGIAIFGTVLTSGMGNAIMNHLPAGAAGHAGSIDAGSVLDPAALQGLPPVVAQAVRHGLADQLHQVFLIALPMAIIVAIATMLIKEMPLRDTIHTPSEAGKELLDTLSQSTVEEDRDTEAVAAKIGG